jgi:hypothetical protein
LDDGTKEDLPMRFIFVLAAAMLLWSPIFACPAGSSEYNGTCVVELKPAESTIASGSWTSDEKPPKTTTGEWQTGKFEIVTLKSQSIDDEIAAAKKWNVAHGNPEKGQAQ